MSKGKLDNYKCDGQISVFDYLETLPCAFSGHTCNKKELWKVADTLDDLMCPHVCCRQCNTICCGARCNGSEEPERLTPAEEYYKETGKKTYWQDSQGKPYMWWRNEKTITLFGNEWQYLTSDKENITEYDDLEILGPYKLNNKERWSCCPAKLVNGEVIAYDVPWDIPRPKWQYWRLKEKVYPVKIKGLIDDAYCPECDYQLDELKELDCEQCPECGTRLDWTPWHRANDE